MRYDIVPDEDALGRCAWCRNPVSEHADVFGAGVTFKPGVDLSAYEGHCIQIGLVAEEKPVHLLVTLAGSEAKQEGSDGMLLFCSEACGNDFKRVLEKEIKIGRMFEAFRFK